MILKNNLATKPVRNYSLYFLGCLALFVMLLVFSIFNVRSLTGWYAANRNLEQKISGQQTKRFALQREATELRGRIARIKTPQFVMETEFINKAIKRRIFSWTTLFDQFERVLPNNVKMVSVLPGISDEKISISMEVAGKGLNDLFELITVLQNTPAFKKVVLKSERQEQDGLHYATITLIYLPEHAQAIRNVKTETPSPPVESAQNPEEEQPDTQEEQVQE
jgi:hypothetical protein